MKIYDKNGWVNWDYILSLQSAFIMVVGARGTGKTVPPFTGGWVEIPLQVMSIMGMVSRPSRAGGLK